jgi:glutathione S-transferase
MATTIDAIDGLLALYHAWVSSASRRVRFALEEKEIAYQSIPVDLMAFEQQSP